MIKVREFSKSSFWNHTASGPVGRIGLVVKRFKNESNYTLGNAISDTNSLQNSVSGTLIGVGIAGVVTMATGTPAIAAYMALTAVMAKPSAQIGLKMVSGGVEAVAPSFWSRTKRWWS